MTAPNKVAKCHKDRPNYNRGKCKECSASAEQDICLHEDRIKDKHGRCTSCMSRYYARKRKTGTGDKFGTPRQSRKLCHIKDPDVRRILVRRKRRIHKYQLSLEDYDKLFRLQEGVCAICRKPPSFGKDLCVDHNHNCCDRSRGSCGKCVRGLLCHGCNMRIGQIESPLLSQTLKYLLMHGDLPEGLNDMGVLK